MCKGKSLGFGVRPGYEGQLHSLLALCPWASYSIFLNLFAHQQCGDFFTLIGLLIAIVTMSAQPGEGRIPR